MVCSETCSLVPLLGASVWLLLMANLFEFETVVTEESMTPGHFGKTRRGLTWAWFCGRPFT